VLKEFWLALPPTTTKQVLSYVAGTLGRDSACTDVRVAVMSGLSELLDQPLAHPVLKNLLPVLSQNMHDVSEKVRVAFLQILCKVVLNYSFIYVFKSVSSYDSLGQANTRNEVL
jgi:condensin-2 complex subunit G2